MCVIRGFAVMGTELLTDVRREGETETAIPLSVPDISGNEWSYVKECLDTGWVSSAGKYVSLLEERICGVVGVRYATACASGTAALQIALQIAGVQAGDEVVVPTMTFIATANAVRYLNAEPVFADCDEYYNIDVEKTVRFMERETVWRNGYSWNRRTGRRVSAIVPVHVFGNAVDMERLLDVCRVRNIRVIEDAAESLGSFYTQGALEGRFAGAVGDIGCYWYTANTIAPAGGGGMIVTNDASYAERARYLTTQAKDDAVRYVHDEVGYNLRLTNLQAAVGVAQLERLGEYIEVKKRNYRLYAEVLEGIEGLSLGGVPGYADCNHWFYCLRVEAERYGMDRDGVMSLLGGAGIEARPVWYLNHWQKPYSGCAAYCIEEAPRLWSMTLNIPCSVGLTADGIGRVADVLRRK